MKQLHDNIFTFEVVLPENPLKWLNCYVIKGTGSERSLIIDTGFNRPECLQPLVEGVRQLGLDPKNTDVFLTHTHSDHSGNAPALAAMGCRIFMSEIDRRVLNTNTWPEKRARSMKEGMSPETLALVNKHNPAIIFAPGHFESTGLKDGDILHYGGYELQCVLTPGHTPGHMCLYDRANKRMFLGDHVLFDITPNINYWLELDDPLGAYLDSLRKIMSYDVVHALPAHRTTGNVTMAERAQALIDHHAQRLTETEQIIINNPGLSAYQIAGKMTWRIRAKNWDEFPPGQKWFAVGEAITHIDHLILCGRLRREEDPETGFRVYFHTA